MSAAGDMLRALLADDDARAVLLDELAPLIRDAVDRALVGRGLAAREYTSRGPLPAGVTARAFRATCKAACDARAPGFRVEGKGARDRVYFAAVDAWHERRKTPRRPYLAKDASDDERETFKSRAEAAAARALASGARRR